MNTQGGYQPPTTVVVVQQSHPWYRGPSYLRQGLRWGGFALSFPIIIYLGILGFMLVFSGSVTLGMTSRFDNIHDEFFNDDFFKRNHDSSPSYAIGSVLLIFGILLIVASICLACYAKSKFKSMRNAGSNPGYVINPNPSSAGAQSEPLNPPHPAAIPGTAPPPGGYMMQPTAGYPPAGYPPAGQPAGYPQPAGQPAGFSQQAGQPAGYPQPAGQPAGYPQPAGQPAGYPQSLGQPAEYTPPAGGYPVPYPLPGQPSGAYPPAASVSYDAPPPYTEKSPLPPSVATEYSSPVAQAPPPSNLPGMTTGSEMPNAPEYGVAPPYAPESKT